MKIEFDGAGNTNCAWDDYLYMIDDQTQTATKIFLAGVTFTPRNVLSQNANGMIYNQVEPGYLEINSQDRCLTGNTFTFIYEVS